MGDHLLRLLRRRGASGADRPDGLVGDHPVIDGRRTLDLGKDGVELALDHVEGAAGVALIAGLPHRHDDLKAVRERGDELLPNLVVALAEDVAALGVTDEREVAPAREHHR